MTQAEFGSLEEELAGDSFYLDKEEEQFLSQLCKDEEIEEARLNRLDAEREAIKMGADPFNNN